MTTSTLATKPFIRSARYVEKTAELEIGFQTATYVYSKVPRSVGLSFVELATHKEMEYAFDSSIEGRYLSRRGSL